MKGGYYLGRKNKSYSKDLHQQAYEKLTSMLALGESKREAVLNGTADDKIFSVNTYKTYWKHIKYFLKYVKEKYPECTTLKKAKGMSTSGCRCELTRIYLHGRFRPRRKPWGSCMA